MAMDRSQPLWGARTWGLTSKVNSKVRHSGCCSNKAPMASPGSLAPRVENQGKHMMKESSLKLSGWKRPAFFENLFRKRLVFHGLSFKFLFSGTAAFKLPFCGRLSPPGTPAVDILEGTLSFPNR